MATPTCAKRLRSVSVRSALGIPFLEHLEKPCANRNAHGSPSCALRGSRQRREVPPFLRQFNPYQTADAFGAVCAKTVQHGLAMAADFTFQDACLVRTAPEIHQRSNPSCEL
jgi:hypothetical protein